jgi:hypothetical protein
LRLSQKIMNSQECLLRAIRKKIAPNQSINDDISGVLNISYDAAHRRISGKSKFSIEETVILANHYKISLDHLFLEKENVIVQKTIEIKNIKDMVAYFKSAALQIESLTNNPNAVLYYSAKDIPLFYFMEATILSKFKAYVWLSLLNPENSKVAFEKFVIDESFMEPMQKLKKAYEKANVKEVWNDTTINSSLQQILYFYHAGLLNYKSALALTEDLKRIVNGIKLKCNQAVSNFSIYYNELILLNNNLLFENRKELTLFVPYTLLGYFITTNEESCNNVHQFFNQQINNSKPLNLSGIKEQNIFFNKMIRKIDFYTEQFKSDIDLIF